MELGISLEAVENFQPSKSKTTAKAKPRVLLAEDCPDQQMILSHVLSKIGMDVTTVNNGKDCADTAISAMEEQQPFDLVLMDVRMPVMDGLSATKTLRESGYALPIVAVTSNCTEEDRRLSQEAGCNEHVNKLDGQTVLVSTVSRLLQAPRKVELLPALPIVPRDYEKNPGSTPVILSFIDSLPTRIQRLESAYQAEDFETISEVASSLGLGSLLGYTVLAGIIRDLKKASFKQDRVLAETAIRELNQISRGIQKGREVILHNAQWVSRGADFEQ